jgi:acyl-CoA dehydrogenase
MNRSGLAGPPGSLTAGVCFGVPPILKFGTKELQERFLPDLLLGKKRTCIAITEPGAGSDVANIQTTAVKSADGKHYIINGQKKWITNGVWADYSSMAVRTGGPGAAGLSMVVVPLKGYPGVTLRRMKVQGQVSGGTTFIELDDVKVPVDNLIGEEGMGMRYVMTNFNHERQWISPSLHTTDDSLCSRSSRSDHLCRRYPPGTRRPQRGVRLCHEAGGIRQDSYGSARGQTPASKGWSGIRELASMGRPVRVYDDEDVERRSGS